MMKTVYAVLFGLLSGAQAGYCFESPNGENELAPRLLGQPRHIQEQVRIEPGFEELMSGANERTTVYEFQQGKLKRVAHTSITRDVNVMSMLFEATFKVGPSNQRYGEWRMAGRASLDPTQFVPLSLNDLKNKPTEPLTVTFDAQGRLSTFKGVPLSFGPLFLNPLQISCTYSKAQGTVRELRTFNNLTRVEKVAQFGPAGRLTQISTQVGSVPGREKVFQDQIGEGYRAVETFQYSPQGKLTTSSYAVNGVPTTRATYAVDARGFVTSVIVIPQDAGKDSTETYRYGRDAKGNWTRLTLHVGTQLVSTTTRTITY